MKKRGGGEKKKKMLKGQGQSQRDVQKKKKGFNAPRPSRGRK